MALIVVISPTHTFKNIISIYALKASLIKYAIETHIYGLLSEYIAY